MSTSIRVWSEAMDRLYWEQVGNVVRQDRRSDWDENVSLGYPFEVIRLEVIEEGLADFTQTHDDPNYGKLTRKDKVLLYCFCNMKGHFHSAAETFRIFRSQLLKIMDGKPIPVLVDLGCGPATAGLAFAEVFPERRFSYIGIDHARYMRLKAHELWKSAIKLNLVRRDSTAEFDNQFDVDAIVARIGPPARVVVNTTFLFASRSLDRASIGQLAGGLADLVSSEGVEQMVLVYTNSGKSVDGDRNYELFKKCLKRRNVLHRATGLGHGAVEYQKSCKNRATGVEAFVYELLRLARPS